MLFRKIVDAPSSYNTLGYAVQIGEFEKVEGVSATLEPITKLATTTNATTAIQADGKFECYVDPTTPNVVRVRMFYKQGVGDYAELANASNLTPGKLILTGKGY